MAKVTEEEASLLNVQYAYIDTDCCEKSLIWSTSICTLNLYILALTRNKESLLFGVVDFRVSRGHIHSVQFQSSDGVSGFITVKYLAEGAQIGADLGVSKTSWDTLAKVDGSYIGAILTFKWHTHTVWKSTSTSGFSGQCPLVASGNYYDPLFTCCPNSDHDDSGSMRIDHFTPFLWIIQWKNTCLSLIWSECDDCRE